MWTIILIFVIIGLLALLLLKSDNEGKQATGAIILGSLLPNLIVLALFIGFIVLIVKACS